MKILLVDDSKLIVEYSKKLIKRHYPQFEIYEAASGRDALETLKEIHIDIMILDIVMPIMDGIMLLEEIRENIIVYGSPRIIMLSSLGDKDLIKKSFELGASDYIKKPIESIEFVARIKAAIRERRLLKEIEQKNDDILRAQSELIQIEKMAGIGQLAAGIAHEINNPVGYAMSNVETLRKYIKKYREIIENYEKCEKILKEANKEEQKIMLKKIQDIRENEYVKFMKDDTEDLIEEIYDGLKRVSEIVKELREFSKVDNLEIKDVYDFNKEIKHVLKMLKNKISEEIEIELKLDELPELELVGVQINQSLFNILENAIYAVKKRYENEGGHIEIRTYVTASHVYVEIEDNGIGIEKHNLKNVFNPFFTTKEVGEGRGLGLTTAYDIIKNKNGGDLIVQSKEGKGTLVIIVFPKKH